jgi:hypothetical protein
VGSNTVDNQGALRLYLFGVPWGPRVPGGQEGW